MPANLHMASECWQQNLVFPPPNRNGSMEKSNKPCGENARKM